MKNYVLLLSTMLMFVSQSLFAEPADTLKHLQHRWAEVNYSLQGDAQEKAFEVLMSEAESASAATPGSAELLIWKGIIESSYAGAKGGLGALSLAKKAKADFENAMQIDDQALAGSAYTSLGTLYFKVPGWPIGFGDDKQAKVLLEKALVINPDGIDSNYFYGQYLADKKQWTDAQTYLVKAQQAQPRPDCPLADRGRQKEIAQALDKVRQQLTIAKHADFID
jgi:tetratricopeptide (TPR) repeat protein